MATYNNANTLYDYDGNAIARKGDTFTINSTYVYGNGSRWYDVTNNRTGVKYNMCEDAMVDFIITD